MEEASVSQCSCNNKKHFFLTMSSSLPALLFTTTIPAVNTKHTAANAHKAHCSLCYLQDSIIIAQTRAVYWRHCVEGFGAGRWVWITPLFCGTNTSVRLTGHELHFRFKTSSYVLAPTASSVTLIIVYTYCLTLDERKLLQLTEQTCVNQKIRRFELAIITFMIQQTSEMSDGPCQHL